ncbi:MAG: prepilin-type N-terminal cleavage/methylation domain-containing protein [Victivallales bacterium]|nr:prepilin-type N-terminal cleavage/methylation domain-containing protein [Victivallales bacterium]
MKRNFTLVELLVVTVIIGIIVGAVVPAFTRLMTGNAVSYGLRMTTSQLNMARVEACARRKYVAVVFPDNGFSSTTSNIGYRCAFRSCFVEKNGSNYKFKEWVPGTKWEYLPKGAYFSDLTDTALPLEITDVVDVDGLLADGSHTIRAVIFSDSGRAAEKKTFAVEVREGVVADNATVTRNNNDANKLTAKVNKYTGSVSTE